MDAETNFWLIWFFYLVAASLFYSIFWIYIKLIPQKLLVLVLRGIMSALIFTPWFVNIQGSVLAPALMIVALDLITIGPDESARAGVPLLLSVFVTGVVSLGLYFSKRKLER